MVTFRRRLTTAPHPRRRSHSKLMPGQRIPHDRPTRTAMFRTRLEGTRTLVVLDNATTVDQVRPFLDVTRSGAELGELDDVTRPGVRRGSGRRRETPSARRAALTGLFDYYLATAAGAMDTLYPAEAQHRPRVPAPDSPAPRLRDPGAALAWLDSERPTMVALAETEDWPGHLTQLSTTV
jgi:hypothetical protein